MRHQKAGRKFGRNTSHRRAMFRNLAGNLVLHERIETTDAKAKELRRIAERLVSKALRLGKDLTVDVGKLKTAGEREEVLARRLHVQRQVARFLPHRMAMTQAGGEVQDVDLVHKLFHEIAPRYLERVQAGKGGGYTRILKGKLRRGDNAPMSFIEFISQQGTSAPAKKKPTAKKVAEAADEAAEGASEAVSAAPTKKKKTTKKAAAKKEDTATASSKKKKSKKASS